MSPERMGKSAKLDSLDLEKYKRNIKSVLENSKVNLHESYEGN